MDWTGRYILLRLSPEADEARVRTAAASILGEGTTRLDRAAEAKKIEAYRSGEPWMRSGETLRLSQEEARILARRFAGNAAGEAGLTEEASRRLVSILEEEIAAAFERMHASQEGPEHRFAGEWATVLERLTTRTRAFLTKEQDERVVASLRRQLAR